MIVLNLPTPPSLNNLFPTNKAGKRFPSKQYQAWRVEAGYALRSQRPGGFRGPVRIDLLHEDKGRCDGDGKIKAVFDLLVTHGVIEDDNRKIIRGFKFDFSPEVVGVRVTIQSV